MEWTQALEAVIRTTRHERFRALTADDHPDHEAYRRRVVEMAAGAAPDYPPVITQAGNAAQALARVIGAAVRGEPVLVAESIRLAREAICLPCEFNGKRDEGDIRCTKCGCGGIKLTFATERCPVGKWEAVTDGDRSSAPD